MKNGETPDQEWSRKELQLLKPLSSPEAIQCFLDAIPYNSKATCRSPQRVLHDRTANCTEGALFAAAALCLIGEPPLIIDLRAVRDDDHVIAPFRRRGRWGALSKSNFSGLRYRSPVFRSIESLAHSYFDQFFNLKRELSLRSFSRPMNLAGKRFRGFEFRRDELDDICDHLDTYKHWPIVAKGGERELRRVDDRLYKSALLGSVREGLYGFERAGQ
jgi:hypothetical protein